MAFTELSLPVEQVHASSSVSNVPMQSFRCLPSPRSPSGRASSAGSRWAVGGCLHRAAEQLCWLDICGEVCYSSNASCGTWVRTQGGSKPASFLSNCCSNSTPSSSTSVCAETAELMHVITWRIQSQRNDYFGRGEAMSCCSCSVTWGWDVRVDK